MADNKNYSIFKEALQELDDYVTVLAETNVVKMDKKTKNKRLETRAALIAAKQAGDPLYTKYTKYRKLALKYRDLIREKYGTKAKKLTRQYIADQKKNK